MADEGVVSDRLIQALRYLKDHPDSSARSIAKGTAMSGYDRDVFKTLDNAAYKGYCQRHKTGNGPWLWEICPDGIGLLG